MEANFIYITAGNDGEAAKIAKRLLHDKLVACVNIIDNMRSMYRWEGEIQEDRETVLIAKTLKSMVPKVIDAVRDVHSYDCPCIVSLPVEDGNRGFLEWIAGQVTVDAPTSDG